MALNLSQQIYQKLPSSARGESGSDFEIPIYIRSQESPKWVSGIDRSTTCHDILESVLRSKIGTEADLNQFTLVEHWRGVERPLSRNSKILKLWLAWGDEQNHVKFVVKKTRVKDHQDQENLTSKKSARTRNKVRRRNSNSSVGSKASDTMHPKVLSKQRGSSKSSPDIQEMMKVILNQGQVIYQELQRRGYQPNPNLSESVSALNRSQSELNLSQESRKSGSASKTKPSKSTSIKGDNTQTETRLDDDLGYGDDMSPPNTTDIIEELIRLHSLNEELQTVETKLHILSANLNQFMAPNLTDPTKTTTKSSAPMKEDHHHLSNNNDPRGNLAECTLQQELDSVKRYNQSAMEDISRNKELISAMELEFKNKKDSIKQLEYDFNLIEKEGKKLGREYEKVLSIEIPDADRESDADRGEDSALEDSTQVIYSELKELKLECQRFTSTSSSDPDHDPSKLLTSPVLTPASASESGVDLSHEGSTSGSESSGPRPSPLSHSESEPLDSKLLVHDFCSTESRSSRIKSSRTETRHGILDDGEDTNSDTGLSSLHSSSDEGAYEFGTLV
ncbi:hypothetical protein TCAL_14659 [Tigriopus californicus]|uniref:Ras-associating domain-containing protein n=1 Tax=Tigriopus californicus TaxID=6832 RepID=A0A553P6V1_TIGCA|nr:ras association domain-containing protein 10-like [Tigriopus californicus]TRY73414.1 hypothetical protein TCAL_14659 [Tigriopus californicus]